MVSSVAYNEPEKEIIDIVQRHPEVKRKIIFAPSLPWNADMFQRPHQLARALAREGALVFYMQPEKSWPPSFTEIEDRLYLARTPSDSFHVVPEAYIYVLTWNIPLLAFFETHRIIYDVVDHLSAFDGNQEKLRADHEEYLEDADLVLATSRTLYEEVSRVREDALFCPNGADFDHFHSSVDASIPDDMEHILAKGKPIIGYHGALARWFDYPLLNGLAARKEDLEFLLIGVDHDRTLQSSGLVDLPNVHWLGVKKYSQLPSYLAHFDVGIIPFVINEITQATSPIKLYEYFAAGIPVVTSPMEESLRYEEVLVASTEDGWVKSIEEGLSLGEDQEYIQKLHKVGKRNAWKVRARLVLDRLSQLDDESYARPKALFHRVRNPLLRRILLLLRRVVKVWRMSGFRGVVEGVYYKLYDIYSRLRRKRIFRLPRAIADTYIPRDHSQVTLYTDNPDVCPDYRPRRGLSVPEDREVEPFSLIATTYNEEESVDEWVTCILEQTLPPGEIVIVDASSTDDTVQRLVSFQKNLPIPFKVIGEEKVNIARGRNIAIEHADYDLIAVGDFGCRPKKDWLEKLIAPFRIDPNTEVVAGWYRAVDPTGHELGFRGWPSLDDVDPQTFLPSSRSFAFRREAWQQAGGYPEWLTLTGEDTYFALELKRFCPQWGFVPSAVVDWMGPSTLIEFWKKAYTWSIGNGESGYNAWLYRQAGGRLFLVTLTLVLSGFLVLFPGIFPGGKGHPLLPRLFGLVGLAGIFLFYALKGVVPWKVPEEIGLRTAQVMGFSAGARRKADVDRRRLKQTEGLFFVLAGVPIDDTGGGARCTQVTLGLLRRNYWVVYINRYPSWESERTGVRIAHPNLFTYDLSEFYWDDFLNQYGSPLRNKRIYALVELPTSDFMPLMRKINEAGGLLLYEMVDDWDSALGGDWYSDDIERRIIEESHGLIGTAPSLKMKLENVSQKTALLLPNAVNTLLFTPDRYYEPPSDLPSVEPIFIYIGALWGEWFDWDLLVEIARHYPEAAVVVIGDYRNQLPEKPPNIHFLGLKPQSTLPSYLAHADVALIPWEISSITQATSPLKLYEYLAMHKPVVAPDLHPLQDIPGVFLAKTEGEFIHFIEKALTSPFPKDEVQLFIEDNNWQARVDTLLEYIDKVK